MEKENNKIQLPLEEIKLAFAASCVEGAARKLGVSYIEIYERMRKVDLINKFILPHYDTLHTESREYLIDCAQLHDKRTGLYLMSNGYIADDFIYEKQREY